MTKRKNKHGNKPKNKAKNTNKTTQQKTKTPPPIALNPDAQTWRFNALDTLFFRESRPMDSQGNSILGSLFPPSARSLVGAVRTALGEANDIDWRVYREQKQQHPLAQLIGYADDFAALRFSGVWLYKNDERLYPAPQNIMCQSEQEKVFFLTIADELTHCDLGNIRLPKLQPEHAGSKPLDTIWLTQRAFSDVLAGKCPAFNDWVELKDILVEEPRIGIARDNSTRSVKKGQLYQTRHIRLAEDDDKEGENKGVSLAIDISGLDHQLEGENKQDTNNKRWQTKPPTFIRLGGEGRIASITVENTPDFIQAPAITTKIALYLLTPLLIKNNTQDWQPLPNFKQITLEKNKQTVWKGKIKGIDLLLHTAITGKAHQEGGWDLANNQPKAVQSYLPAGCVFYCTTTAKPEDVIEALHGTQIGDEINLGRGKLAVGKWV